MIPEFVVDTSIALVRDAYSGEIARIKDIIKQYKDIYGKGDKDHYSFKDENVQSFFNSFPISQLINVSNKTDSYINRYFHEQENEQFVLIYTDPRKPLEVRQRFIYLSHGVPMIGAFLHVIEDDKPVVKLQHYSFNREQLHRELYVLEIYSYLITKGIVAHTSY